MVLSLLSFPGPRISQLLPANTSVFRPGATGSAEFLSIFVDPLAGHWERGESRGQLVAGSRAGHPLAQAPSLAGDEVGSEHLLNSGTQPLICLA